MIRRLADSLLAFSVRGAIHGLVVLVIGGGLAIGLTDVRTLEMLVAAARSGHFEVPWRLVGVHFLLAGVTWGGVVCGWRLLAARWRAGGEHRSGAARPARGAVMVETVIVLPFVLLMISGLAQLAMLNVAAVLADLAAYQGARTAWIWKPEAEMGRYDVDEDIVKQRARTASALALAPTASASYSSGGGLMGSSLPDSVERTRDGIADSMGASMSVSMPSVLGPEEAAPENLSFAKAFDDEDWETRAEMKLQGAFFRLPEDEYEIVEQDSGDEPEIGVHFVYEYELLFPWFGYLFADEGGPSSTPSFGPGGSEDPWIIHLEREYWFPEHPIWES